MSNIVKGDFNQNNGNFYYSNGGMCEYFKIDFKSKKILAYKNFTNNVFKVDRISLSLSSVDICNLALMKLSENKE